MSIFTCSYFNFIKTFETTFCYFNENDDSGKDISQVNEHIFKKHFNIKLILSIKSVSYKLQTRSGNSSELANMISRCNAMGVRIYVDAVINHMTGLDGVGSAGSIANYSAKYWPGVPYFPEDFHPGCGIEDYNNDDQVRNCWLVGLADLDQSVEYVREKIIEYMNGLIDLGVAGFRVDAMKHMLPADIQKIFDQLNNLNTKQGFAENSRPFITQEVIDLGGEGIKSTEYTFLGTVTEFKYSGKNIAC